MLRGCLAIVAHLQRDIVWVEAHRPDDGRRLTISDAVAFGVGHQIFDSTLYAIEYTDANFAKGCAAFPQISIVRRDLQVSRIGSPKYVRKAC